MVSPRISRRSAIALALLAGCNSGPAALHPPKINPSKAARSAIAEFDRDGDDKLSKEEWGASPELSAVATQYDKSGDGTLDADELEGGFTAWQENSPGPRQVPFSVSLDNQPLAGATVRLVPAAFFSAEIKPVSSETGPGGGGLLTLAPEDMPKGAPNIELMQPGLYRIEVTHPSRKIPAKYNTETTLGIEITSANPGPRGVHWSLTTK
jgi:hypothetical protein